MQTAGELAALLRTLSLTDDYPSYTARELIGRTPGGYYRAAERMGAVVYWGVLPNAERPLTVEDADALDRMMDDAEAAA